MSDAVSLADPMLRQPERHLERLILGFCHRLRALPRVGHEIKTNGRSSIIQSCRGMFQHMSRTR